MGMMAFGLFITILLLFHQISSSIQQSNQVDPSTNETQQELVEARGKICGLEREIECEQKERSDEFTNSKISQIDDRSTKIRADLKAEIDSKVTETSRAIYTKMAQIETDLMGKIAETKKKNAKWDADLVDGRESNRELERKVAEMKRKNDDLEAQLKTQNTEVKDGRAKIVELEGQINALQSKISDLETQINRTMNWILEPDEWSYLAKTASWYKVIEKWMTFDDAVTYCASRKGHLVTIHSQEENDFVWKLAKNVQPFHGFWIGLKRNPNKENAFEWMDGSSVDFTNWGVGHPSSYTHTYLSSDNGKWRVYAPTQLGLICKIRSQF
ncbi:unnamed protein product, partial [Mesorhabditis belari]|uniref:C-type lectin domain-containing protein n=1 Tax=Mesorhabditis belari TaxID=2138241 RepID=A0AAF3J8C1_9BILA